MTRAMAAVAFRLAALLSFAAAAAAADACDVRAARQNEEWGKTAPHSWLASVEHKQAVETARTWCHIWAAAGADRISKAIDFGRVLFTGDGLHPAVGSIVPGSGLAGGLAYNLERAAADAPVRFSGSLEARGSSNGFWTAGGKLDIWGSGNTLNNRHIHATLEAAHYELPQLTYFGLGNSSSLANETVFGLAQSTAAIRAEYPLPRGWALTGALSGLSNSPSAANGGTLPSIQQKFTPSDTPALTAGTTYVVAGGGIAWIYPVEPHAKGFTSSLTAGYRLFHETSGAPYSFRRLDAIWMGRYTLPASVDLGAFSLIARFTESYAPAGNSVPFYLQPTLGGTDIGNVDVLRSYRDYRFRAPNLVAFQAEYRHSLWGPLAAFGFYDAGRVALDRSDIGLSHLRHSFGAGLLVQAGGLPVFKFYYAWGGHEGSHTTYTGNTNNFSFTMPGGVF
ncbi:MAG TPA: hypothetical protein VKX45_13800 [Bryobacteraceae bacterium]|jgi:hypothetical protein|nr:hypothetical protein [Bryobacteraceae bacterium]